MDQAFKYIEDNGLALEADYPYTAQDGTCRAAGKTVATKVSTYTDVPSRNVSQMEAALRLGPVSIAVDANVWQSYSSGIIQARVCGQSLDHGVLLVGYTPTYWIVKNSWAASWGLDGYVHLQKGGNDIDTCGLLNQASYPGL